MGLKLPTAPLSLALDFVWLSRKWILNTILSFCVCGSGEGQQCLRCPGTLGGWRGVGLGQSREASDQDPPHTRRNSKVVHTHLGMPFQTFLLSWISCKTIPIEKYCNYPDLRVLTNVFCGPWCWRLCSDGEEVSLYHTMENSRVYHKEELKFFEIKPEVSSSVLVLFLRLLGIQHDRHYHNSLTGTLTEPFYSTQMPWSSCFTHIPSLSPFLVYHVIQQRKRYRWSTNYNTNIIIQLQFNHKVSGSVN